MILSKPDLFSAWYDLKGCSWNNSSDSLLYNQIEGLSKELVHQKMPQAKDKSLHGPTPPSEDISSGKCDQMCSVAERLM